jgi:hypothetical protein
MSNGQQGQQSTLQNVYSYSFTANNLFQISLVKDNDPNRPTYKRQFFCFLTLAPGEQAQGGGRTYNFTNKINMKQDVHNIIALSHAFRAVARGQKASIGNFSLFTDSSKSSHGQGGGVKQVFLNEYIKQNQNANQNNPNMQASERFVSLGFRIGSNKPIGLMFSVPDALACADILEHIGKLGLRLDMSGASVSFASKPPPQPSKGSSNDAQYQETPAFPNSTDSIADNFQEGLQNAASDSGSRPGPASPPPMGGGGNDDIPF